MLLNVGKFPSIVFNVNGVRSNILICVNQLKIISQNGQIQSIGRNRPSSF